MPVDSHRLVAGRAQPRPPGALGFLCLWPKALDSRRHVTAWPKEVPGQLKWAFPHEGPEYGPEDLGHSCGPRVWPRGLGQGWGWRGQGEVEGDESASPVGPQLPSTAHGPFTSTGSGDLRTLKLPVLSFPMAQSQMPGCPPDRSRPCRLDCAGRAQAGRYTDHGLPGCTCPSPAESPGSSGVCGGLMGNAGCG